MLSQVAEGVSLEAIVDPRLGNDYDPPIMMRMVECAAAAVRQSVQQRPSMVQVRSLTTHTALSSKPPTPVSCFRSLIACTLCRSSNTCKVKHEQRKPVAFSKLQPQTTPTPPAWNPVNQLGRGQEERSGVRATLATTATENKPNCNSEQNLKREVVK